jgi:hypothetical protein
LYLNGLCYDCSIELTGFAPELPEDPVVSFTASEKEIDEGLAKTRELNRKGFVRDFPWVGAWTFEAARVTRINQQVAHIREWMEEAQREMSWVKLQHAIASLAVLAELLPGGEQ